MRYQYQIIYILHTCFSNNVRKYVHLITYFSNNICNFINSKYTFFKEYTQLYKFNVHIHNSKNSTNTFFEKMYAFQNCVHFCIFNLYIFFKTLVRVAHARHVLPLE